MKRLSLFCLIVICSIQSWAEIGSGTCGDNVTWSLSDEYVLTISGTGEMQGYNEWDSAPWDEWKELIKECVIEEGVTSIGSRDFYCCSNLTSISIPSSITEIYDEAFAVCINLQKAEFTSIGHLCNISIYGGDWYESGNPLQYAHHLYIGGEEITDLVIPDTVTKIGRYTFEGCSFLNSVTIPSSVISIGAGAFSGCDGLQKAEFASIGHLCSISFDGVGFFESSGNPLRYVHHLCIGGEEITDLVIPDTVTRIGSYAFDGCSFLNSVTIPSSVTSIGANAFSGCENLQKAEFASIEHLCSISFETSIFEPYANPLGYAHHLYIGGEEVKEISVPNTVTTIGDGTFMGCSEITSVSIPSTVTSIGQFAFAMCPNLTEIESLNEVPPSCDGNLFDEEVYQNATLYVPVGAKEAYSTADVWCQFVHICEKDFGTQIGDTKDDAMAFEIVSRPNGFLITGNSADTPVAVFDLKGTQHYSGKGNGAVTLPKGCYVVKCGNHTKKIIIN